MEEVKLLRGDKSKLPTVLDVNAIYVATSNTENDFSSIYVGGKEWSSKEHVDALSASLDTHLEICVTQEEFSDVKDKADSAVQADTLKTVNGQSLIGKGEDITIDLALFTVVSSLPTENINPNKIYLIQHAEGGIETNKYDEYIYHAEEEEWEMLGTYTAEIDLSEYIKTADADSKYMKLDNGKATVSIGSNGSMNNYGDNGQAFNAVRDCGTKSKTGYALNAAAFGIKLDSTTAFSHKKYDSFDPTTGTYAGAKNTAVLTFAGNLGLRYAKNTGSGNDVTDDMYRYVGVIDSQDERQRVYSKAQVDSLISKMKTILSRLGATDDEIASITI